MNQEQAIASIPSQDRSFIKSIPAMLWLILLIVGQAIFAWYIIALYSQALSSGSPQIWNRVLDSMNIPGHWITNFSIGVHLFTGAVLSVIGPIQLIPAIREKALPFHRILGGVYIISAMTTAIAGLVFILFRGTVGGLYMNVGFALYGILILLCAYKTWTHVLAGRIKHHRRWAIRLFVLGMSSLLYRVEYGLWGIINDGLPGHNSGTFDGPFDIFMDFAFYIPTLLACELYFYACDHFGTAAKRLGLAVSLLVLIPAMSLGLYAAFKGWWIPAVAG